jgi:shikimate dehydrogenase
MKNHIINELIEANFAAIGKKAKYNPTSLDSTHLAVGIANKDYSAQTPFLWNSVYAAIRSPIRNIRMFGDPEHAPAIFEAFHRDSRYIGGDVGVGYKDRVLHLLDDIDPLAKAMGSVNVIVKTRSGLKGYNTDGYGFVESLEVVFKKRSESLRGKVVVLLGAGGTANSIAFALVDKGASVAILNRTVTKAEDLARRVNDYFGRQAAAFAGREALKERLLEADAVVSVIDDPHSPLDTFSALASIDLLAGEEGVVRNLAEAEQLLQRLSKKLIVCDVMLRDHDTATIAQAKALGFETLNGMPMVLNQAIEAFCLVNHELLREAGVGRQIIADIMKKALLA